MIRVLQCVNIMDRAGLENMLMNYYRNIDRNQIQFDFLTHREEKGAYDDEINSMGGKVYHAPRLYPQNYPAYFNWMKKFFRDHQEYKIVHSHIDAMSFFPLLAAKKAGIPIRIAHSHSTKLDRDFKLPIKYVALKLLPYLTTYNCACGELAGKFMFGSRDFKVIGNAIDIKKFSYNQTVRDYKREQLDVKNKFVVGHVGRYCYIKNQLFLIDVFNELKKIEKNAHLLLIGKGEDEYKIREKVINLKLQDSISVLVDRADVAELYQAMDVFVMPSLFEGVPVVGVEAQTNGLPCVVSSSISKEILLTDNIKMIDLNAGSEIWAKTILSMMEGRNQLATKQVENKGYNVEVEKEELSKMYNNLILEEGKTNNENK